jgi:hypothetical protein
LDLNSDKDTNNKKKIAVLSKIDELKVVANNHYLKNKFDEAIKIAEEIMDMAEKARLYSIVREQGEFIGDLYKKAKENNKFTEIEKQQNILKKRLEPLEIEFDSYISTNNITLAEETLEQAKTLLKRLKDTETLKMWETSEAMLLELKKRFDINEDIEHSLTEVSRLIDNYEFDKAKHILNSKIKFLQKEDFLDYQQKLKIKMKSLIDAEDKYLKLEEDLKDLESEIKQNVSQNQFEQAINNIKKIIKISRFIGKNHYLEKYTEYIDIIENKIREVSKMEDLKTRVNNLNVQGIEALKYDDYSGALEIFKEILSQLKAVFNKK